MNFPFLHSTNSSKWCCILGLVFFLFGERSIYFLRYSLIPSSYSWNPFFFFFFVDCLSVLVLAFYFTFKLWLSCTSTPLPTHIKFLAAFFLPSPPLLYILGCTLNYTFCRTLFFLESALLETSSLLI